MIDPYGKHMNITYHLLSTTDEVMAGRQRPPGDVVDECYWLGAV
jgi:hypothetical protein